MLGIDDLIQQTGLWELRIIPIESISENLLDQRYYLDYVAGKNADNIQYQPTLNTLDYYQGLIFIRDSKANETYEMYR